MIETRLLQYFLAVARELNITKAAEALCITQPTLSKQMMELEAQLGKQLFIRGKRRLTLTEDGAFLRSRAQEILELMDHTESAFRSQGTLVSGHLTIGCGETIAMRTIAQVLAGFHNRYPGVTIHTHSGDADMILQRLDSGLADMGLLLGPIRQEKYDYLNIHHSDRYGLLMPADCDLANQPTIAMEQLKSLPLILSAQTFAGRHDMEWIGSDSSDSAALDVKATYNLIYNATFLVEEGIGYALCLQNLVNTLGRNLVFRPIVPELTVDLYMVTKKYQTFSPAAKAFLQELRETLSSKGLLGKG